MADDILNWDNSKGNPYFFPNDKYEFEKFELKTYNIDQLNNSSTHNKNPKHFKVVFPVSYYLYRICKFEIFSTLNTLIGVHYINDYNEFEFIINLDEDSVNINIDTSRPLKVYTSYPFNKQVEIIIKPFKRTVTNRLNQVKSFYDFNIGYIIWQISKAYEDIYSNKIDNIEIWGHSFPDLAFGLMVIYEDNEIEIVIDS